MKTASNQVSQEHKNTTAVDLNAVLEHQIQIETTQKTIAALSSAIGVQDAAIAKAQASIPQLADRASQRENLMAEITLGEAKEGDLHVLDEQIAKDKKAFDKANDSVAPLVDKARTIRAGLERKLNEAKETASRLESHSQEIRRLFLIQEAEKAAAVYIANAEALKLNYRHLRALEILINSQGGKSIKGMSSDKLYIPVFSLQQFNGLADPNTSAGLDTFYNATWDGLLKSFSELAEYEKERLEGLGIQF